VSVPAKKEDVTRSGALRTRLFAWSLCVSFILGLVLIVVLTNRHSDEPHYQGKALSTWITELSANGHYDSEFLAAYQRQRETLTNVVRSIGTNGLPLYLDWIEHAPQGDSWYEQATEWISDITSDHIQLPERPDHSSDAVHAIQILGPDARTAIPSLRRLLESDSTSFDASYCLSAIGPEAIPTLMDVLEHSTNGVVRSCTVRAAGDIGTAALPLKATLIKIAHEHTRPIWPGISTSDLAMRALAEMPLSAEELMPLFTEQFLATNAAAGAAYGLARLGSIGSPVLMSGLTNEDRRIRAAAKTGLDFQQDLQTNSAPTALSLFERFDLQFDKNLARAGLRHVDF
jgi:hypothetical protein